MTRNPIKLTEFVRLPVMAAFMRSFRAGFLVKLKIKKNA
jgi:hypothetical protein